MSRQRISTDELIGDEERKASKAIMSGYENRKFRLEAARTKILRKHNYDMEKGEFSLKQLRKTKAAELNNLIDKTLDEVCSGREENLKSSMLKNIQNGKRFRFEILPLYYICRSDFYKLRAEAVNLIARKLFT